MKIYCIGIGPGGEEQMTLRAVRALEACDCVAGYGLYLDLIDSLIEGKERIQTGMTREVDRCAAALERAKQGKTVAVVSSGDAGVYGMAGLLIELAAGTGVEVEVIPGITAACSGGAVLGSPLTCDFACISLSDLLTLGIGALTNLTDHALTVYGINPVVHGLVIDGIFAGVGSVLSFLPTIVTLFFFLSILEDTGYMARVAFVMDQLLRRIGLSGRSFVPMLIGFGCSVPAIMATRTLSSDRDRKMTILLTPFMSCSAKLPIYSLFAVAFFPKYAGLVMVLLYFTGILVGVLAALLLKSTVFKGEAVPFVMELPNYRLPGLKNVAQLLWEKARDFLQRAFTVIFGATIIIWFLQNFDLRLSLTVDPQTSILARIAGDVAPLFAPLGFADWRISTALISGFMAKESVVSSLLVLFGSTAALTAALTPAQAAPLLVFCLLYTPCIAAVASVKRELGGKWAAIMVVNQCAVAWLCALLVRLVAVAVF